MRCFFPIIIVFLFTGACNNNLNKKNADALVKVGNKILYKSDLDDIIQTGLSPEDSIIAAEHFIHSWISENLLYNVALKNINDKENVERLVENYRKSLMIYQYEEQLVNERLTSEIDEQSLYDYYNLNKDKLKLDRPLVKGLFLKVPVNAPQLNEIRRWYKLTTPDSRDKLEEYSLYNITVFEYFTDRWVDFNDLIDKLPKEILSREDLTVRKKTMEKEGNGNIYFLNITDFLMPGENAPFEYAKTTIREIIINHRKIDFLKKTEADLYQRALAKGEIHFYDE